MVLAIASSGCSTVEDIIAFPTKIEAPVGKKIMVDKTIGWDLNLLLLFNIGGGTDIRNAMDEIIQDAKKACAGKTVHNVRAWIEDSIFPLLIINYKSRKLVVKGVCE